MADVARRHGINANQVFNWRRRMQARAGGKAGSSLADPVPHGMVVGGFVPVGVIMPSADGTTAVCLAAPVTQTAAPPDDTAMARQTADGRSGIIEIDLACGTRLLVDALVREQALRRVLSALKVAA